MDPAIRLLRDLVTINSINPTLVAGAPGEQAIGDLIADRMQRIGLAVEVQTVADRRPNVIGVLEGNRPGRTLMFCGHTDTVGVTGMTEPFDPVEREGRLFGRGAQDMKGGLAAMIDAARVVAEGGLERGRLIVACVVDEEHSSVGADALVGRWTADAAIVTEPTDLAVAVAHKGFAWIEIEVFGKAAHGSRPNDGQDAILRLGRVLSRLEHLDRTLQARAPHTLVGTGSLHASIVTGGCELSSYPDRAMLQMERRSLPDEPESQALDEVQRILNELRREDASLRATARTMFSRPAYEISAASELPVTLAASAAAVGRSTHIVGASFWADSAVLGHAGIPAVLFGPGGAGLHSTEEYVNLADVVTCRDVLVEMTRRYC